MNDTRIIHEYDDTSRESNLLQILNGINETLKQLDIANKKILSKQDAILKEIDDIHEKLRGHDSRETNAAIRMYAINRHPVPFIPSTTVGPKFSIGELLKHE